MLLWLVFKQVCHRPLALGICATALGGACDRSVYRIASNLLLSARLVSHNSPIRMTSDEALWKNWFLEVSYRRALE